MLAHLWWASRCTPPRQPSTHVGVSNPDPVAVSCQRDVIIPVDSISNETAVRQFGDYVRMGMSMRYHMAAHHEPGLPPTEVIQWWRGAGWVE